MRLICPNCGAQYEVPDEVIPETGRDVQCSNCGDTWFQHHPDHPAPEPESEPESEPAPATQSSQVSWDSPDETATEAEAEPEAEPVSEPEPEDEPEPEPEPEDEPEPDQAGTEHEDDLDEAPQDVDETDDSDDHPEPSRRQLDPAIADVLREEAEHEREARAAESAGSLESQPDLGLTQDHDDDDRRAREARARMARLRGEDEEEQAPDSTPEAEDIDPSSRRNLLPDIDEINSSLDAGAPASTQDSSELEELQHREYTPRKSSGFRRGFSFAIVLAALLLALYVYAPRIAEMVPALAGPLETYVEQVNALRVLVDDQFGWVREWLKEMSSPATPGG